MINKGGTVCFSTSLATRAGAIFTSDGVSLTKIFDSNEQGFTRLIGSPSINSSGSCAFTVIKKILPPPTFKLQEGIFVGNSAGLTEVVDNQTLGFSAFRNVAINAEGEIVFGGIRDDGSEGIFVAHSKADHDNKDGTGKSQPLIDTVLDSNINPDFSNGSFGDPVINKEGTVADVAFLDTGLEIFTGNAKGVTARTDPTSPLFVDSEHPSINDFGIVAFSVTLAAGGNAILVESTGGASPVVVIKTGDTLFGSTVTTLFVGRFALNNHNELVFQYRLNDGRSGVAIAALHLDTED